MTSLLTASVDAAQRQISRILTDYRNADGRNVANGMSIDNCAFFCGGIDIDNCRGVSIASSIVACSIRTVGGGANRIAGNYMIIRDEIFEFCPSTIIEGNFTDQGPWEKNNRCSGVISPDGRSG